MFICYGVESSLPCLKNHLSGIACISITSVSAACHLCIKFLCLRKQNARKIRTVSAVTGI